MLAILLLKQLNCFVIKPKNGLDRLLLFLAGLDTLVFSGGIGEHSPEIRSKICDGLGFLGIELDEIENMNNECHYFN